MLVATVIVHYQNLEDTLRCVESLQSLDYKENAILIVDSCSPNKTGIKLKELLPEVTVILNPENNGFAASCNVGIKHAQNLGANYIWLLNPDTSVASDALSQLIKAVKDYPDFAVFGSKVLYGDRQDIIWSAGAEINFKNRTLCMLGNSQPDGKEFSNNKADCDYLPGCSLFASVETFCELLPEEYFMYFEETDWCQTLIRKGKKILLVADSKVYHHTDDEKMQSTFHIYYYNRNQLMFWYKFASPIKRIALICEVLFRRLPRNTYAYLKAPSGQLKATFMAHTLSSYDFILGRSGKRPYTNRE